MSGHKTSNDLGYYGFLIHSIRILLGTEFTINGLNWWIKLIGPYPSISDFAAHPLPDDVVGAMIKTGILFHLVKATELLAGLALLCNRFVPLALVMVMPVTINVFVLDVMLSNHLRAHVMGSGAMLMNVYLTFAYLRYYRPMLDYRTRFDRSLTAYATQPGQQFRWLDPQAHRWTRNLMIVVGTVTLAIGMVMIVWVFHMMAQHVGLT